MNFQLTEFEMFSIFRQRMNDNEAASLVNFVYRKLNENDSVNVNNEAIKNELCSIKNDIHKLNMKIIATKEELLQSAMIFIVAVLIFLAFVL